ncbi:trichohyalin-like isoform X2 [Clupea harengus]|uniref:Trichohyalin-like isoform X2 n=1 Tax=Clupea harengus TaxID=7950 RepID=A0A8M1KRG7_CLUHA|nr:trichohyalin-like isoform X2 [Clupea harengus]
MMDNCSTEMSWKEGLDTGLLQERIGIQKEQTLDWIEIKNMLLDSWKKQGKHGFLYEENIMPTMDKPKVEKEPQRKDLQAKFYEDNENNRRWMETFQLLKAMEMKEWMDSTKQELRREMEERDRARLTEENLNLKKDVLATQEIPQEHIFAIAIIFAIASSKTINEDLTQRVKTLETENLHLKQEMENWRARDLQERDIEKQTRMVEMEKMIKMMEYYRERHEKEMARMVNVQMKEERRQEEVNLDVKDKKNVLEDKQKIEDDRKSTEDVQQERAQKKTNRENEKPVREDHNWVEEESNVKDMGHADEKTEGESKVLETGKAGDQTVEKEFLKVQVQIKPSSKEVVDWTDVKEAEIKVEIHNDVCEDHQDLTVTKNEDSVTLKNSKTNSAYFPLTVSSLDEATGATNTGVETKELIQNDVAEYQQDITVTESIFSDPKNEDDDISLKDTKTNSACFQEITVGQQTLEERNEKDKGKNRLEEERKKMEEQEKKWVEEEIRKGEMIIMEEQMKREEEKRRVEDERKEEAVRLEMNRERMEEEKKMMDANNEDNLLRSLEEERMRALELEKRNRVTDEQLTDTWTEAVNVEVKYSNNEDWIDSEHDNECKIQTDEKRQDLESKLEESIDKELSHGEHSDIDNKLAEKEVERSPTSMAEQSGKSSVKDEEHLRSPEVTAHANPQNTQYMKSPLPENMASQTLPPRQDELTDSVDGDTFCKKQEYSDYDGGTESEKLNNEGKIQKAQEIQTEDINHKSEDSIVEELSQDDQSDIDFETVHLVEVESNISSFTNMRKPAACAVVQEDQSGQQSAKPKDMAKEQKDGDMKAEILGVEEQGKRVKKNSQKHKTKQEQETIKLNMGRERMEEEIKMMDEEHENANMSRRLEEESMSALEEEERRRVKEEVGTEMVKGHPSPAEKLDSDDKVLRVPKECEKEGKKGRNKGKEILTEDKEPMMKPEKTAHANSENILLKSPLQGDHLSPIVEKVTSKPLPPLQDMDKHQLDDGSKAAMGTMKKQNKKAKDTRKRNTEAKKRKDNEVKRLEMDRDTTEKEKKKMVEEKKKAELIWRLEEERLKAMAEVTETDMAKEQKDGDMKAEILRVEEQGKRVQENNQKHKTKQEQETMKLNMGRERMEEEIKMMDEEHENANMSRRLEEESMSALEEEERRRVKEEVGTEMVKGHPSPAEKLDSDDKVLRVPEECEKEGKKGRNKGKEILTEDKDHLSPIVEKVTSKSFPPLQDMGKHQLDDGSNRAMETMRQQKKKAKDARKRNIQAEKRKYNEVKRLEMDRDTKEKEKKKMVEEKKKAELIRRLEGERLKTMAEVTEILKAKKAIRM